MAKATPDGYTLLMVFPSHPVNASLYPDIPFDTVKAFAPVSMVSEVAPVLIVHSQFPAKSVKELVALAKAKPKGLNYASSGTGTPYHMAGELFKAMAGVDILHVPYKGSSGARTDVLGGQVDLMFDAVTTMTEHVRQGKVKALGTTGKTRSEVMPDVPTIAEAGVPGY